MKERPRPPAGEIVREGTRPKKDNFKLTQEQQWTNELIRMVRVFLDDDKPMAIPDYEAYRDLLRKHMKQHSTET